MLISACPPSASPSGEAGGDTGWNKEGFFFIQHRASGNQYLYASSNKFDKLTQTRRFEAGLR